MKWKRWKVGLIVAALTGGLTGLAMLEIVDHITGTILLKIAVATLGLIAKDALLFMKDHPVEQALDDAADSRTKV